MFVGGPVQSNTGITTVPRNFATTTNSCREICTGSVFTVIFGRVFYSLPSRSKVQLPQPFPFGVNQDTQIFVVFDFWKIDRQVLKIIIEGCYFSHLLGASLFAELTFRIHFLKLKRGRLIHKRRHIEQLSFLCFLHIKIKSHLRSQLESQFIKKKTSIEICKVATFMSDLYI